MRIHEIQCNAKADMRIHQIRLWLSSDSFWVSQVVLRHTSDWDGTRKDLASVAKKNTSDFTSEELWPGQPVLETWKGIDQQIEVPQYFNTLAEQSTIKHFDSFVKIS